MKNAINKYLRRFGIEIHGVGYIQKLRNSDLKKSEWQKQKELLKGKANVIFDVGANRGNTTLKYLKLFSNARIHSFEPFPESYEIFINRHKDNLNVHLNKYALSSSIGEANLNVNKSVDTNSLLESKKIGANSDKSCISIGQIEIETNTIDSYCAQNNIKEIDILKIDVQGSEIEVLKGALEMLKKGSIKLIYTETYFEQQYVNQPLFHDISQLLYTHNFVLQDIYDPYFSKNNMLWCDSIFVNLNSIY
jgi:FkbM family methyltransferase